MISVIIPAYNQAANIGACLDSLLTQTYQDFEVIIVNDGSTDNTLGVLQKYETRFSKFLLISQENKGAPAARNRGFKESKGEYVLFCDADAKLKPEALQTMQEALSAQPNISFVYCSFKLDWKKFVCGPYNVDRLRREPYICTFALVRRTDFSGFDEKIKRFQDWDLWLTMMEQGKIGLWLDKVLVSFVGGGTMSIWLPGFVYKFLPNLKKVKKYEEAMAIIKQKHQLPN